ncbi:TPA: hypothetical protein ACS70J_003748 [Providencia alcalifaciens]
MSIEIKKSSNNIEPRTYYNDGYFTVINMCDYDLKNVSVRHSQSGMPQSELFIPVLRPLENAMNAPKKFGYATGIPSGYDYWYIEFSNIFGRFATKSNFYCSLTPTDDGNVVVLITPDMKAKIRFSYSTSCSVAINPK